ncbi:PEP-CTERM sorting domain-containing protein [Allopontixanthobacter sediminis]|uniref:PEP-CTERM sorting domain-containing protein n=1 Tax=Allopontixanthobacter sediminis TaxID=1689985 RepID=A0A845B5D3_9SPHN|nr:PEP-CTERM sorting domain-containing protein [Allopontixanthobacter sediminis]MXP45648.1 PEP-CTERM sorting domain-containing protein [Allopontixanthobacter sediminis]
MTLRLLILALIFVAAPAAAGDGIQIPEPSNMALMGLGLVGLIIGRHTARSKRPRNDRAPKD